MYWLFDYDKDEPSSVTLRWKSKSSQLNKEKKIKNDSDKICDKNKSIHEVMKMKEKVVLVLQYIPHTAKCTASVLDNHSIMGFYDLRVDKGRLPYYLMHAEPGHSQLDVLAGSWTGSELTRT